MGLSYSIDNDKKFSDALDRAKKYTSDLRVPFGLIARDFYRSQKAIFNLKGPGQYEPFKQSEGGYQQNGRKRSFVSSLMSPYQMQKIRHFGFDYPLLKATGDLEEAASVDGGRGNVTLIGEQSLVMGVDSSVVPYAIYPQSSLPRHIQPLRKFIFIGPEAPQFAVGETSGRLERWVGIIDSFIQQKMQQAFGG